MTEEQRAIKLQQLANIVIDAYLNRDKRFVPEFRPGRSGFIYFSGPKDVQLPPDIQIGYFYRKSDYEPEGR